MKYEEKKKKEKKENLGGRIGIYARLDGWNPTNKRENYHFPREIEAIVSYIVQSFKTPRTLVCREVYNYRELGWMR